MRAIAAELDRQCHSTSLSERFQRRVFVHLLVSLAFCAPAEALPARLTVNLFESYMPAKRLNVSGAFELLSPKQRVPAGQYFIQSSTGLTELQSANRQHPFHLFAKRFILRPLAAAVMLQYSSSSPRRYRGTLCVFSDQKGNIKVENVIDAHSYVVSVVGSETDLTFPLEALKAQAVLTLTKLSSRHGEHVGDSTEHECYFGSDAERPLVKHAVDDVWGRMLTYKGKAVQVFYHSACAGKTSSASDVFGRAAANMPYLKCVSCHYCDRSPFWKATSSQIQWQRFQQEFGQIPAINSYDCAGRPEAMTLTKDGKVTDISGYQFWIKLGQKFGWDKAPGTRFKLALGANSCLQIESTGAGHPMSWSGKSRRQPGSLR